MFVKPAPGRTVPDPAARDLLPETGRDVAPSPYWHRRLAEGDAVAEPITPVPAKTAKTTTKTTKACKEA